MFIDLNTNEFNVFFGIWRTLSIIMEATTTTTHINLIEDEDVDEKDPLALDFSSNRRLSPDEVQVTVATKHSHSLR